MQHNSFSVGPVPTDNIEPLELEQVVTILLQHLGPDGVIATWKTLRFLDHNRLEAEVNRQCREFTRRSADNYSNLHTQQSMAFSVPSFGRSSVSTSQRDSTISRASTLYEPTTQRMSQVSTYSSAVPDSTSVVFDEWSSDSFSARAKSLPAYKYDKPLTPMDLTKPNVPNQCDPPYNEDAELVIVQEASPEQQSMLQNYEHGSRLDRFHSQNIQNLRVIYESKPLPEKPKSYFCFEPGCSKTCSDLKHLKAHAKKHDDHRSNSYHRFECRQQAKDPSERCTAVAYTEAEYQKHHREQHPACTIPVIGCQEKRDLGIQKQWACGICSKRFDALTLFANHHESHVKAGRYTARDVSTTMVMRGLLDRPETQAYWRQQCAPLFDDQRKLNFEWADDDERVKTLLVALSHGIWNEDHARSLVDEAMSLRTQFTASVNAHSADLLKRKATASPSTLHSPRHVEYEPYAAGGFLEQFY